MDESLVKLVEMLEGVAPTVWKAQMTQVGLEVYFAGIWMWVCVGLAALSGVIGIMLVLCGLRSKTGIYGEGDGWVFSGVMVWGFLVVPFDSCSHQLLDVPGSSHHQPRILRYPEAPRGSEMRCPECGAPRTFAHCCPECGTAYDGKVHPVIEDYDPGPGKPVKTTSYLVKEIDGELVHEQAKRIRELEDKVAARETMIIALQEQQQVLEGMVARKNVEEDGGPTMGNPDSYPHGFGMI